MLQHQALLGAHDAPEWCSRWAGIGAHVRPESLLTIRRNTQQGEEQIIERVDTNALYTNGDTIRLTIESPTSGFLYIVDQEQYSDGSYGPAKLVFPTLRTRKGNNLISAWKAVDVPASAVWQFKPRELTEGEPRKTQIAEVLTIIISPTRLVEQSRIGEKQLALNKGEFEKLESPVGEISSTV